MQRLPASAAGGRRFVAGLALLVSGLWLGRADVETQSLGDLARREAGRRATVTTAARVYSNVPRPEQTTIATPASLAAVILSATRPPATTAPGRAASPSVALAPTAATVVAVAAGASSGPPVVAVVVHAGTLTAAPTAPAPAPSLSGWSAFQIRKTAAELAETARLADAPDVAARSGPNDVRLPPQHDALRIATGIGYLTGADFGGDVTASGKINGMQTDASGFGTAGAAGFQSRSARLSIVSPDGRWRGEGGDLFSDLRGLARGARLTWSPTQKWTPSVVVYVRGRTGVPGPTVVGYRDRLQLLPRVRIGGEVTSDGALFVQTQYAQPALDVTAFYRATRGPGAGHDTGLSGGLALGRGVAVSGAFRLSDAAIDSRRWHLASLRLPLMRQSSVTLERSQWTGSIDDGATNAVTLQLPIGPVRLIQRMQWGRTDYRHRSVPYGFDRRQSQSSLTYTPGPWGTVNYQQSLQWFEDGTMQEWDEASTMLQLGRRTTAQFVTAFPDILDPRRLRARITQRLSPTLDLEAQYGRLSAFQTTPTPVGEQSRVMVTIRKMWQLDSPARGGEVRGRARDQAGYGVSGALVRLGPYSAVTDAGGDYTFTRVPDGRFELALDRDKLPAAYALDEQPRPMVVTRTSRAVVDLQVIPLNAMRGRVYLDRNHNGVCDEDEGVANVVLTVNGAVTATAASGSFAFYNQPPGRYRLRLDVARLPKGLAPTSAVELDVELTPDAPLVGLDFTLEKKDMPIRMREIPK